MKCYRNMVAVRPELKLSNLRFVLNIEIYLKTPNLGQKPKFWSKIKILVNNQKFPENVINRNTDQHKFLILDT